MSDTKIKYFIDYWRDLTHSHNSIESEFVHSILYNPKELFKEFIEEIERKNLSNNDNKKFFQDKTNEFARLNLNALNFIKPTLTLIQQQFSKKDDYSYLLHLLKMIVVKLEDFSLGKEAVNELSQLLTEEKKIEREKIKHLTNIIIFELIHKKYSSKKIIQIIDNIFSGYQTMTNGMLYSNFPHKLTCDNWEVSSSEFIQYQSDLKDYIDNLTYKERIQAISNYFDKEPEKLRFVFQIKGLKGDDVNIKIGNVQIYNPKSTRLFNNPTEHFNELFEKEIKDNIYYCNGAVELDIVDGEYAKQEALQILENTLDLIASRYTYYKFPISINSMKYYIIDNDGNEKGSGSSNTWEYLTYQDALELDNSKYKESIFSKPMSKNLLEIDKKILESMHWKRKAIESNENNEKILWHWVTLENIFTKHSQSTPKTIFEVVSKMLAKKYMFGFAWKHYHKLKDITANTAPLHHYRIEVNLPKTLKDSIGLNVAEGETIYLKNFIDNIEQVKSYLDKEELFYEQLDFLNLVFNDSKECLKLIEKFEKIFFEKLVYIYRVRNKIVHNAHNESSPIINYYVDFIEIVSSICINTFIQKRAKFSLSSSDEIINNIIYDYDEFKLKLKDSGIGVLLK